MNIQVGTILISVPEPPENWEGFQHEVTVRRKIFLVTHGLCSQEATDSEVNDTWKRLRPMSAKKLGFVETSHVYASYLPGKVTE